MLQKIIDYLRSSSTPVDLEEMSRAFQVERSALSGMLETLLRQGRIAVEEDLCCDCPFNQPTCANCTAGSFAGNPYKRYTIPQNTFILPRR